MFIKDIYSHKDGEKFIRDNHPKELDDIFEAVASLDVREVFSKSSLEVNKPSIVFSPIAINKGLKNFLCDRGWTRRTDVGRKGFVEPRLKLSHKEFRELDGLKNKVGLEVQFGKYSFMAYDIFTKMPIFANRGLIDCGIEIVASAKMIKYMSTGVGSYTQIVTDMRERGVADIDIPTIVIGLDCTNKEYQTVGI